MRTMDFNCKILSNSSLSSLVVLKEEKLFCVLRCQWGMSLFVCAKIETILPVEAPGLSKPNLYQINFQHSQEEITNRDIPHWHRRTQKRNIIYHELSSVENTVNSLLFITTKLISDDCFHSRDTRPVLPDLEFKGSEFQLDSTSKRLLPGTQLCCVLIERNIHFGNQLNFEIWKEEMKMEQHGITWKVDAKKSTTRYSETMLRSQCKDKYCNLKCVPMSLIWSTDLQLYVILEDVVKIYIWWNYVVTQCEYCFISLPTFWETF